MIKIDNYEELYKGSANPVNANNTLNKGILSNIPQSDRQFIESSINVEEETNNTYYTQKYGNQPSNLLINQREEDYGKDSTVEYANQQNKKAAEYQQYGFTGFLKTVGASIIDTAGNASDAFITKFADYILAGQASALMFVAGKSAEEYKEFKNVASEDALKAGRRVGRFIKNITPESFNEARDIARQRLGDNSAGFFETGFIALADSSGNIGAASVNAPLGFLGAFGTMRNQTIEELESVIGLEKAAQYGDINGVLSGGLEYLESTGRLGEFLGWKEASKKLQKPILSALKKAGINLGEEIGQDIISSLIYNEAITEYNISTGNNISLKKVFDIDGNTVEASLAMSTILNAFGLGTKALGSSMKPMNPSEVPYTLGDANRVKKRYTPEQIQNTVESNPLLIGDEKGQSLMSDMLNNPSEQAVKAYNDYVYTGKGKEEVGAEPLFGETSQEELDQLTLDDIPKKTNKITSTILKPLRFFTSITTRLNEIAPPIARAIRASNQRTNLLFAERSRASETFANSVKDLIKKNKDQKNQILADVLNGNWKSLEDRGVDGVQQIRDVFNEIASELGIENPMENYFVRRVKDYDKLVESLGENPQGVFKRAINDAIKKNKGKPLTDAQKAKAIKSVLRPKGQPLSYKNKRTIDKVTPEMVEFYQNPFDGLSTYLYNTSKMSVRKSVFGADQEMENEFGDVVSEDININNIILRYIDTDVLSNKQQRELESLLRSEFEFDKTKGKGIDKFTTFYRKLVSLKYVANLRTAAIQFGDIAVAIGETSLRDVISASKSKKYMDAAGKEIELTLDNIGVNRLDVELRDTQRGRIEQWLFTPLQLADNFNKTALLRSSANQWFRLSKSNPEKLNKILMRKFKDEKFVSKIIDDMSNEKVSNDVAFALYAQMADFHPLSYSENIGLYLNYPALRPLFVLKSFAFKRLDRLYREAIFPFTDGVVNMSLGAYKGNMDKVKEASRDIAEGSLGLGRFLMFSIAAETLIEKAWKEAMQELNAEPEEIPEDESFTKMYMENLSRIFPMLDTYSLKKAVERKDPAVYLEGAFDPAETIGVDTMKVLWKHLAGDEDVPYEDLIGEIPIIGQPLAGKIKVKTEEEEMRKRRLQVRKEERKERIKERKKKRK